ncbi:hypothetical protein PMAYCL1PPCAC_13151, partial [Pristionchus mayeri]
QKDRERQQRKAEMKKQASAERKALDSDELEAKRREKSAAESRKTANAMLELQNTRLTGGSKSRSKT